MQIYNDSLYDNDMLCTIYQKKYCNIFAFDCLELDLACDDLDINSVFFLTACFQFCFLKIITFMQNNNTSPA